MRAIDLYSGIGGWTLGLKLAGIDVVRSYEWWQPALDTHNNNHNTSLEAIDIRKLELSDLPKDIDVVVGSPPCTQFSYSNRGGSGDVEDGLVDLVKFFSIVSHLKPKFWAMENVPRVAKVLQQGFSDPSHALYRFKDLNPNVGVIDLSDFGCPQARRRCIATNIRIEGISNYAASLQRRTLGDVITALAKGGKTVDPVWGVTLKSSEVTETEKEACLSDEELRLNRDSKVFHPVYNNMSFPDRLDFPSRTVTATCTRVSRESIVVEDQKQPGHFRRLTIRERATLQGFPLTYQFYGRSFAEKAKMIGNAIPPTFTYVLASAIKGVDPAEIRPHFAFGEQLVLPKKKSEVTKPDSVGRSYPVKRRFRAAIPNLRFKSGMRVELANRFSENGVDWDLRFYSGDSKNIRTHLLDQSHRDVALACPKLSKVLKSIDVYSENLKLLVDSTSQEELQAIWTRRLSGKGPFVWVDGIGELADQTHSMLLHHFEEEELGSVVFKFLGQASNSDKKGNEAKIKANASRIASGILVGIWFNNYLKSASLAEAA